MPPEPSNLPALREPSTKQLGNVQSAPGLDFVASFYDASALEAGYKVEGFTAELRAELLARMCKDPDPKIALKALSEDRATRREMLLTTGLLKTARAQEIVSDGEGHTLTRTLVSHRLTLPDITPGITIRRPIAAIHDDDPTPPPSSVGLLPPDDGPSQGVPEPNPQP